MRGRGHVAGEPLVRFVAIKDPEVDEAVGLTDIRQLQRTVRDVGPAAAWRDGWAMGGDADRRDAV